MARTKTQPKLEKKKDGPTSVPINSISLRVLLNRKKLTQQALADLVGVHLRTVQLWLRTDDKHSDPTVENFEQLCRVLDVPAVVLNSTSRELERLALHMRVMDFYVAEVSGENEPTDYRELQLIREDISNDPDGGSEEDEVKPGTSFVSSEVKPHPDPVDDTADGDGVSG